MPIMKDVKSLCIFHYTFGNCVSHSMQGQTQLLCHEKFLPQVLETHSNLCHVRYRWNSHHNISPTSERERIVLSQQSDCTYYCHTSIAR